MIKKRPVWGKISLTENNCNDGCWEVIYNSSQTDFSWYLRVQGCDTCGQQAQCLIEIETRQDKTADSGAYFTFAREYE